MKKFKTVLAIACAAVMTLACLSLTGCGVDGTYKYGVAKEAYLDIPEVAEFYAKSENMVYYMIHGQMISNFANNDEDAYSAELTLDGGNYTYYKGFKMDDNYVNTFGYAITFYGTYEENDGAVTLAVPTKVYVNAYTWLDGAGTALTKDKEYTEKNDESEKFFKMFNTKYLIMSEPTAMTVTVDSKTGTFEIK